MLTAGWKGSPPKFVYSLAEITELCDVAGASFPGVGDSLRSRATAEFFESETAAKTELQRACWTSLNDRQNEICDLQAPLMDIIQSSESAAAPVTAARLDVALSTFDPADLLEDYPIFHVVAAQRALLPSLPANMAEQ